MSDARAPFAIEAAAALAELTERDAVARLWAGDYTLWRPDPDEISDRLGWLTVVPEMLAALGGLEAQCTGLAADVDHVLLMGMGGSSLFPEVVANTFEPEPGRPKLHVVDTTDPDALARVAADLAPERTFHIAASKSGSTLETRSHLEWAWARNSDPSRFGVITDPGSELEALANERGFAAVWRARPDIGGRYSALSHFGIVPALLTAPTVARQLLASATAQAERLRATASANPAAQLAAAMGSAVRAGRDKVTIVVPDNTRDDSGDAVAAAKGGRVGSGGGFGLWLEQLLAESTGKDGTGVVPIVGEPLGDIGVYGDDRLFVALGAAGDDPLVERLAMAGHPVHTVDYDGPGDLGAQVLTWEMATALCGALLGIHPFDQPDVAAAKAATNKVLDEGIGAPEPTSAADLLDLVQPGDYVAIQAFVDPFDQPLAADLERTRKALRDRLKVATTLGVGPRFLHSTGQLHKGGPNTGVFVQVVGHPGTAVAIPGRPYDFGTLEQAQATGDFLTLQERGRRVGRVTLDDLLKEGER